MSETKFQDGDKVEWAGAEGVVAVDDGTIRCLKVKFLDAEPRWFYADGRFEQWHKEPSLKLIERPKKKVAKTMYQVIYGTIDDEVILSRGLYKDDSDAREAFGSQFIALGPAITFEVEE